MRFTALAVIFDISLILAYLLSESYRFTSKYMPNALLLSNISYIFTAIKVKYDKATGIRRYN
jgi:hypothetical protein